MEFELFPFDNPYRPSAGHPPPHLAGRDKQQAEFDQLLKQDRILTNLVLTGLRGVGKTVLLDTFKPRAQDAGWLWVGNDLSESASVNESTLALRIIADLAVVTAATPFDVKGQKKPMGFNAPLQLTLGATQGLSYDDLLRRYDQTPGLVSDKIKSVLEFVWGGLKDQGQRVIFSYDEAQNLADHAEKDQYPLSVLLDVFQSIQRKGIPFMLVLTGLPMLFPKLVEARTYAERMFRVMKLDRLTLGESREAVRKPLEKEHCPVSMNAASVDMICQESGGYPFFIQFICRDVYDIFISQIRAKRKPSNVPLEPIIKKLDTDFFAGRWAKVTDRQRDLLWVIASLSNPDGEFTVQETVEKAKKALKKPFSNSHVNQMLATLMAQGLVYQERRGTYLFAVPLMGPFILRTYEPH